MKVVHLKGDIETGRVWLNGKELDLDKSLKVRNHSPSGFNWGYGGSGPAQLALAICLELYGSERGYQQFKWWYISRLPQGQNIDINLVVPSSTEELLEEA